PNTTSSRPFRLPPIPSSRVPGSRQVFNLPAEGSHLQPPPSEFAEKGCEAEGVTGQVTCDDQVAAAFGAQALQFSKVDVDVADQIHAVRKTGVGNGITAICVGTVGDDDLVHGVSGITERQLNSRRS